MLPRPLHLEKKLCVKGASLKVTLCSSTVDVASKYSVRELFQHSLSGTAEEVNAALVRIWLGNHHATPLRTSGSGFPVLRMQNTVDALIAGDAMAGPNEPNTTSLTSAMDSCRLLSVVRTADRVGYTFDCVWPSSDPSHEHLGSQEEADTLASERVTEGDSASKQSQGNATKMPALASAEPLKKASLLGMPQELRDIISDYVFTEVVQLSRRKQSPDKWQRSNLGLLRTCRQLYSEAREMYYKCSIFKASFSTDVIKFLRNTPKGDGAAWYLPLVKEIRLWDFTSYMSSGDKQKQLRRQRETIHALWCIRLTPGVLRMSRKTFGGEIVWDVVESSGKENSSEGSSA